MQDIDKNVCEKLVNVVFPGLTMYVRDVNLSPICFSRYEKDMIILERGFTDASKRIMGMVTTHRYAILSNHMLDFSLVVPDNRCGLCVAKNGAHFQVLDIYSYQGKTQILLLHLPDDERWKLFENVHFSMIDQLIETSRKRFQIKAFSEPVPELCEPEWIERCSAPLGMDEAGNLFPLKSVSASKPQMHYVNPLDARPGIDADQKQIKALENAKSYFMPKRGLANDFIFPASLLDELDDVSRKQIEAAVIQRCNNSDDRFFDALENVKTCNPMAEIEPLKLAENDEGYSRRSRLLKMIFLNKHDIYILLILFKMAASSSLAFYHLASAVQKTDWESMDNSSEVYQLFLRTLKTFTCVKRVIIRESYIYDLVCKSNLKQESSTPFLSAQDLSFFVHPDPWTIRKNGDPLVFYKALMKRELYLQTKDLKHIKSMISEALRYPEVYDVISYMRKNKELDNSQFDQLCGSAG